MCTTTEFNGESTHIYDTYNITVFLTEQRNGTSLLGLFNRQNIGSDCIALQNRLIDQMLHKRQLFCRQGREMRKVKTQAVGFHQRTGLVHMIAQNCAQHFVQQMRAHSATHLLDAALKKVLGDHVHQAGSLVEPDRLRFDFTHFEAITPEQLAQVDQIVNDAILEGIPVVTEVLPIEEAKKKGAVAMFGEKYSDVVRVVEMGGVSMEFCGGTHVDNTAKVGPFRIKSEASVASGVRRIEATVGQLTLDTVNRNQQVLFHIAQMFKTNPGELESRLEQQMNEMKELRHALEKFKEEASLGEARSFLMSAKDVGGLKVITAQRDGMDATAMRKQGDFLRDKEPGVVGVLASVNEGKVTLLAVCGKDAVARGIKAGDIIKAIVPICGGKGGGKPDSAMGGGTEPSKVDDALAVVDDFVAGKL